MKKLICYMLMVWLALMSGGANAHVHAAEHHSHEASHQHELGYDEHAVTDDINTLVDLVKNDGSTGDSLSQAHSGHCHSHNHVTALPSGKGSLSVADLPMPIPVSSPQWASKTITNNIERPKWPVTTPAVVNLLS